MKQKIRKLLFEYTTNSRITTKELGKNINASQQSASYILNTLKKKKIIGDSVTIVDSVKLGYISVLVGFNFLQTDSQSKKEVIEELKEIPEVTGIEEGKEGIDLLVEYCTLNLSAFNKIHTEIIYKFFKRLRTTFVFPIIVSHKYPRNYLSRKTDRRDLILSGDRMLKKLGEKEFQILDQLIIKPDKKLVDISEDAKIPIKTVIKIKKLLEKKSVIKGYTAILDYNKLSINRQIIFLRITSEGMKEIDKFNQYAKFNKNIIQFTKLIGSSQVLVIAESLKELDIIRDIRTNFPIDDYLIFKSEKLHKRTYLPVSREL